MIDKADQSHMAQPKTVLLADYHRPEFLIDSVALSFDLDESNTQVSSVMQVRRNGEAAGNVLKLNGRNLELVSIKIDGHVLDAGEYELETELHRLC